jgi:HD-like signal output (HDOD) protein
MTTTLKRADESKLFQLSTLQLPTLPAGTPFLLKSLTNENIDFIELAAIVEKFPSIAGKLISLVNSAWSAPASAVSSLETTCSRLGFGVVRSTSIALAIATPFNPTKCSSFDPEYFWCSALLTADAASRLVPISSSRNDLEPATARAAGLLHNLALLWLVDKLPAELDQALTMVKNNQTESLQQALIHVLGFDQQQAGGHLGSNWALPVPLVEAMTHYPEINYQGSQREIVTTVGLAVKLVSAVLKEEPCPEQDVRLSGLGIAEENLAAVFEQLNGQLVKTQAIAKVLI